MSIPGKENKIQIIYKCLIEKLVHMKNEFASARHAADERAKQKNLPCENQPEQTSYESWKSFSQHQEMVIYEKHTMSKDD